MHNQGKRIVVNETEALHTAARRYCFVRCDAIYDDPAFSTGQRLWGSHRVRLLQSICTDVESVLSETFASPPAMRDYLLLAGQTATIPAAMLSFPYRSPKPDQAIDDERECYTSFIENLTPTELVHVEPLPFHYRLDGEASKRTWDMLTRRWGAESGHYWYPLIPVTVASSEIVALQEDWFRVAVSDDAIRDVLSRRGITHVWELHESGTVSEIDLAWLEPEYAGYLGERYWTAGDMDWLLYASHESSITIAGAWLIAAIKETWPDWHTQIYTGWEYERPPTDA